MTNPLQIYRITPSDLLFCRDSRPMETGQGTGGGYGANWPLPSLFFRALHAALYRAYPTTQGWEHGHATRIGDDYPRRDEKRQRFGSLVTVGPFPAHDEEGWLFPQPADVLKHGETGQFRVALRPAEGTVGDLPAPLSHTLRAEFQPDKHPEKIWLSKTGFEAVLGNGPVPEDGLRQEKDLFRGEWTTGNARDAERNTQDGKRLFSSEYLRLRDECRLGAAASMPLKERNDAEGMEKIIRENGILVFGGQLRTCGVEKDPGGKLGDLLPVSQPLKGATRVRWVLLSPAVFPETKQHRGGWLPSWVNEKGKVQLRKGETARRKNEPREAWRNRVRQLPRVDCQLVAARIPKPLDLSSHGKSAFDKDGTPLDTGKVRTRVRQTRLAVPAGAVYYFEGADAETLSALLSWHGAAGAAATRIEHRRSTLWGEQGFGIGVCGPWETS